MILAQKAAIKRGDEYLMLRRADGEKAFPGLWDFPGGKWEEGEDFLKSLQREVFEETQLTITPQSAPAGVFHADVRPGVPVEFRIYRVLRYAGTVGIGEEHAEFRWMTKEKILALPVMPYMKAFLQTESGSAPPEQESRHSQE